MMKNMIILNNRNIKTIKLNKSFNYKNLGSFKIIKIYDNFVYELKLFIFMKKVHPVFYS